MVNEPSVFEPLKFYCMSHLVPLSSLVLLLLVFFNSARGNYFVREASWLLTSLRPWYGTVQSGLHKTPGTNVTLLTGNCFIAYLNLYERRACVQTKRHKI